MIRCKAKGLLPEKTKRKDTQLYNVLRAVNIYSY